MNYVTKIHKFPLMHPMGLLSGTHLHDYNLKMIEDRPSKKLIIGDCFGYYGCSGWWYLFDNENVIKMNNKRSDMEKDKIDLDNYRVEGTTFEEIIKIYNIPIQQAQQTTNKEEFIDTIVFAIRKLEEQREKIC